MRTGRWVARGGPQLFFIYVVVSLIPILALGGVLLWHDEDSGVARALAQARAQAEVIMQMAISPALDSRTLSGDLSTTELNRLWAATDLAIYSGSLDALRLRSFDGAVVFADTGNRSDPLPVDSPQFQEAAHGGVSAEIVPSPTDATVQVIRVVQQVVPNATGRATGILQLYLPYEPIRVVISAQQRQTQLYLGGGLALLYVALAAVSWTTTRRLRQYASEQSHQARHDSLTGLPNRGFFQQRVSEVLADIPNGRYGAVVLVDLDRFKEVNDTAGHHAGDELLCIVARRLSESMRTDDMVARLGGDEFGMLLPDIRHPDDAVAVLRGVQERLGQQITISDFVLTVEASFGVAFYPEHGSELTELLHSADTAMYHAKRGGDRIAVWQPQLESAPTNWHLIRTELGRAIAGDELELLYQPKIDLSSGEISEVEALLRWNHPQRGVVSPADFIPVAEGSMLIHPMTQWVLRRALADRQRWQAVGVDWPVAVNVSAHNLETREFADEVLDLLREFDAPPESLALELTETAVAADNALAEDTLARLAAAGVRISLDDFGTGNTGLQQLRHIPASEVKIDKMFVTDMATKQADRDLVAALIDVIHHIGARVVAEGIEEAECANWLISMGCDIGQGYLYGRPAPWTEFVEAEVTAARQRGSVAAR